jgi:hypothetical protein
MKRKFYKEIYDRDFDVDYNPNQSASGTNSRPQRADPFAQYTQAPDLLPQLKGPQLCLWIVFAFVLPF